MCNAEQDTSAEMVIGLWNLFGLFGTYLSDGKISISWREYQSDVLQHYKTFIQKVNY